MNKISIAFLKEKTDAECRELAGHYYRRARRAEKERDQLRAEVEKLRKDAETERAIERAAEVLPLGFSIEIEIEKDAGTVALFGPGPSVYCDFQGSVAEQINDAIDAAIQEASQ